MKKINAYEYKDLSKEVKEQVYNKTIDEQVEFDLDILQSDFASDKITEAEYYRICGCSKSYAESTSWFVPSCYFEHNKEQVIKDAEEVLSRCLFTKEGRFISNITK